MSYFPFFMELSGQPGLVVGGGTVALRKIEKLLPYGPCLTVTAPGIADEIARIPGLVLHRRPFAPSDLDGKVFAVAATADRAVNHEISALCRRRGILVNVVDDQRACTFLFPALVKRGPLSIGISSGGTCPAAAIYLKNQIAGTLPENLEEILDYLHGLRPALKAAAPDESRRAGIFSSLFQLCVDGGAFPSFQEIQDLFGLRPEGETGEGGPL